MSYEIINVGGLPNDGTGDPVRVAFIKVNNNFTSISSVIDPVGSNGSLQFKNITVNGNASTNSTSGSANLVFNSSTNTLILGGNILPQTANLMDIGSNTVPVGNIYVRTGGLHFGNVKLNTSGNTVSFTNDRDVISDLNIGNGIAVSLNVANAISYGTTPKVTSNTFNITTNTNAPDQEIFVVPATTLQTIKFDILSVVTGTPDRQSATVVAIKTNAGTSVSYTVHNTLFQGNTVTNYSVTSSYGNVSLKLSPFINSTMTHSISYQYTI